MILECCPFQALIFANKLFHYTSIYWLTNYSYPSHYIGSHYLPYGSPLKKKISHFSQITKLQIRQYFSIIWFLQTLSCCTTLTINLAGYSMSSISAPNKPCCLSSNLSPSSLLKKWQGERIGF